MGSLAIKGGEFGYQRWGVCLPPSTAPSDAVSDISCFVSNYNHTIIPSYEKAIPYPPPLCPPDARPGRRRHVDADRPEAAKRSGHAGTGPAAARRLHLQPRRHRPEGRRRPLRRRLHGRGHLGRRAGAHQPPLRLRRHPAALERGARLPDGRLLGHEPTGGAAVPGTHRDLHRPHPRRDGLRTAAAGQGLRPAGHQLPLAQVPDSGVRPLPPGTEHHPGHRRKGRAEDLLRWQPLLPLREDRIQRHPHGGCAAVEHRQVRRRHGQLDVAPPHGRLLHLPHLCRQERTPRCLQSGQRAPTCEETSQHQPPRLQGG